MPKVKVRKVFLRGGRQTAGERNLVKQFVQDFAQDQPREVTQTQINALGRVMRRTPDTIKAWLVEAREQFIASAGFYVGVHAEAVRDAAAMDSATGKDIAIRGAQWAMENMGFGGERIVEKKDAGGPKGTTIAIGVKIGGQNPQVTVTDVS